MNGGLNPYVYVEGNPVNFVNPLGLSSKDTDKILSIFDNTIDEMTKNGKRLQFTSFNNTYRAFGGGTLDCWEQTEFMIQRLELGEYDNNWLFIPQAEPGHVWGIAVSSNPEDPYITFDTRSDAISIAYDKDSGYRCPTCHGWTLTKRFWNDYEYINYPEDLPSPPQPKRGE